MLLLSALSAALEDAGSVADVGGGVLAGGWCLGHRKVWVRLLGVDALRQRSTVTLVMTLEPVLRPAEELASVTPGHKFPFGRSIVPRGSAPLLEGLGEGEALQRHGGVRRCRGEMEGQRKVFGEPGGQGGGQSGGEGP